jgi:hypothetical protein
MRVAVERSTVSAQARSASRCGPLARQLDQDAVPRERDVVGDRRQRPGSDRHQRSAGAEDRVDDGIGVLNWVSG